MKSNVPCRVSTLQMVFSFCLVIGLTALPVGRVAAADDAPQKDKPAEKTREVKIDDITLQVPESWKQQPPSNNLRKAQFEIPKVEGDSEKTEVVVSFFRGSGGGREANITRWIGKFQSKGRKAKATEGSSTQGKYAMVDISGTYNKPIGPPIRRQSKPMPGARMLGVILAIKGKGNYFIKLIGPQKTVSAAAKALRSSFGADAKTEKDLKVR